MLAKKLPDAGVSLGTALSAADSQPVPVAVEAVADETQTAADFDDVDVSDGESDEVDQENTAAAFYASPQPQRSMLPRAVRVRWGGGDGR